MDVFIAVYEDPNEDNTVYIFTDALEREEWMKRERGIFTVTEDGIPYDTVMEAIKEADVPFKIMSRSTEIS